MAILPWRQKAETVALVPTMGALHRGHMTLVEQAQRITQCVIVSIFVNPTQFGANEDLSRYPRRIEADLKLLAEAGCDLVYMPSVEEMYPEGFATRVDPGPLATILEGAARPGHFQGVATVVSKFLMQLMPDAALFGEKDYQQLLVIRRITRDLDIPAHIISVPIARDRDGLALSSRNAYLTPDERQHAVALPHVLLETAKAIHGGATIATALTDGKHRLAQSGFHVDYMELADAETLEPVHTLERSTRLLAAARIGTTRLIDNVAIEPRSV